jgi:hypothetical protein
LRMAHHRMGDAVPASASEIAKLASEGHKSLWSCFVSWGNI